MGGMTMLEDTMKEMGISIRCLALELPAGVYTDVKSKWFHLTADLEALQARTKRAIDLLRCYRVASQKAMFSKAGSVFEDYVASGRGVDAFLGEE